MRHHAPARSMTLGDNILARQARRLVGVMAAPVTPIRREFKEQVMARFPGVGIWDAFGQTEMSPVVTVLKPQDALQRPGSVGKAVVNVEIPVVDDQGPAWRLVPLRRPGPAGRGRLPLRGGPKEGRDHHRR